MEPDRRKVETEFTHLLFVLVALGSAGFFSLRPLWALWSQLPSESGGQFFTTLFDPFVLRIAEFTFYQAFLSTAFSAAIGLPLGIIYGRWFSRHPNSRLPAILALPYGIPSITAATLWIDWLGRKGILANWGIHLDWAYSIRAVLVAHVFFNSPLIALHVAQARRQLHPTEVEAAQSLGASPSAILSAVEWPKVKWAFYTSCSQVFGLCAMSFAIALLLGGGPPVETLETEIYRAVRFGGGQPSTATACAFWELVLTLTPWIITQALTQKRSTKEASAAPSTALPGDKKTGLLPLDLKSAMLVFSACFFVFPYFPLFSPKNLTGLLNLALDEGLRSQIFSALRYSLCIATVAASLAVGIATCQIRTVHFFGPYRKQLTQFFLIPGGISALVLALGFWKAFPPQKGVDPLLLMILVQVSLFIPFAFRQLLPVLVELNETEIEAARSLGAGPWQIFQRIQWPQWKRPLVMTVGILISLSLGEMGAVSLFATTDRTPLPILVNAWMETYQFESARAVSALILGLSGLSLFLFEKLSQSQIRLGISRKEARSL